MRKYKKPKGALSGTALREAVFTRDGGICARCKKDTVSDLRESGKSLTKYTGWLWQADHVFPLSIHAEDPSAWLLQNVQTLCHECHCAKSGREAAFRIPAPRIHHGPKRVYIGSTVHPSTKREIERRAKKKGCSLGRILDSLIAPEAA